MFRKQEPAREAEKNLKERDEWEQQSAGTRAEGKCIQRSWEEMTVWNFSCSSRRVEAEGRWTPSSGHLKAGTHLEFL